MIGLTQSRSLRGANSEVKTAAAMPTGTATAMATRVTLRVPTKSGTMEYLGTSLTGCQMKAAGLPARQTCGRNIRARSVSLARAGSVKRGSASRPTKMKMRTTAAMPVRATAVMPISMAASRSWRRRMTPGELAARMVGWEVAVTGVRYLMGK